ncbi:hypothetical protein ACFVAM_01895 [Streptomyces californicus]|uniref:hypothetical protein n=1 Tax=Streptomyces californicus TaxID=67351 RepID=UPI003688CCD1
MSTLPPLATVEQLEDWLQVPRGSAPADTCALALKVASALVRLEAHTTFTRRTDTVALRIVDGMVRLPGPVVSVASVSVAGQTLAASGWWREGDELWVTSPPRDPRRRAVVTLTHGFLTVPDDVVGLTLDVASRGCVNPLSLRQESTGQRSVTFATETLAMSLAQIEKDKLARYRDQTPVVRWGRY